MQLTLGQRLADRITLFCRAKDLPLRAILQESGIDRATFSRWRSGEMNPRGLSIERVEAALKYYGEGKP